MRACTSLITVSVFVLLGLGMPAVTWADLPPDQTIEYLIRETPEDPNSPVVFAVTLALEASDSDGNSVGWDITEAEFVEFDEYGDPARTWVEDDTNVPTTDGLWWIEHADPADPQPSEFAKPPLLEGTAAAEDPAENDLDYALEGVTYTPPPEGQPYQDTAAIDHEFILVSEIEPIKEGEDEPVEIDDTEDPPGGH